MLQLSRVATEEDKVKEEDNKSITEGINFGKLSCHNPSIRDINLAVTTAKIMSDKLWHRSALPLATEETQEVAPQIEIETNLADASANRRTKQEQRPSLFGLCLARRRKTEGQNEIENQIHQSRLIKYKIETNNYGKGQTGVHHCRGQRVCRCIQAEPKELREQSQTCLSYAERRLRKTLVN